VTMVIALSWCFGLTTLLIGHLNILSITFAPLILGLGIDYGAHWFARYQEEEESGLHSTRSELLRETMEKIGPGIIVAGLSLAVSFLPLTMTGFKGLVELGIICCTGMVVTNLASLTVLPALVMVFDSPRLGRRATRLSPIKPMYRMKTKRTVVILAVSTAALILSVWQTFNIRFDLNMLHLQSPDVESVVWEEKLLKGSELSSIFGEILEPSLEDVRAKTKALKSLPTVSRVESVEDLLPQEQEAKLKMLKRVRPILDGIAFSPTAAQTVDVKALKEVLGRIRFKMLDTEGVGEKLKNQMVEVRTIIDEIRNKVDSEERERVQKALVLFERSLIYDLDDKLQTVRSNVNARPMTVNDLPHSLFERLVTSNGQFLIRVYPKGDVWDPQFLGRFVQDLRSVAQRGGGSGHALCLHPGISGQCHQGRRPRSCLHVCVPPAGDAGIQIRSSLGRSALGGECLDVRSDAAARNQSEPGQQHLFAVDRWGRGRVRDHHHLPVETEGGGQGVEDRAAVQHRLGRSAGRFDHDLRFRQPYGLFPPGYLQLGPADDGRQPCCPRCRRGLSPGHTRSTAAPEGCLSEERSDFPGRSGLIRIAEGIDNPENQS